MPENDVGQPSLTRMHFSEFQKWQVESGNPHPVFDQSKGGWVVFGRDDLFAKRTDMPLWQALAKEQGIEIFLNVPKAPDAIPAEENTITNAQTKLDLNEPLVTDPQQPPGDNTPPSLMKRLGALFTGKEALGNEHPWLHEPPESIAKRYLYTNGEYYFRDRNNARAFSDEGERLKTPGNDPIVIASMVEVAKTKGWTSLHLKGTEEFKREAWYQAKLAGLDVTGFEPKPVDQARLAAAIGDPIPDNTMSQSTAKQLAQGNDPSLPSISTAPESIKQPTKEQTDRYNAFMGEPKQDVLARYPEMGIYYELLKRKVREDLLLVTDPSVSAEHHQKLKATIGDMVRNGQVLTPEMLPEVPPLPDSPSLALRAIAAEQAKLAEKSGAAPDQIQSTVEDVLRYGGKLEAKGIALELPLVLRQNEPAGKTVELAPKTFRKFEDRDQKLTRGR